LAASRFWFIMRLAAKAPCRCRPVSSTLGIALNIGGAIANCRKNKHAGTYPSGIRSPAMPTARTTDSRVRRRVTGALRGRSVPSEAATIQSVGGSAATRRTVPNGTSASGGGNWHRLQSFQRICARSLSGLGRRTSSTACAFRPRPAMPNPALNRSANGKAARPRGSACLSSASRPGSLAVVARLALR
jgi:hypothetical protein